MFSRYHVECSPSVCVLLHGFAVVVRVMWLFCVLCALCTMFQECTLPLEQRSLIRVLLAQYGRVRTACLSLVQGQHPTPQQHPTCLLFFATLPVTINTVRVRVRV